MSERRADESYQMFRCQLCSRSQASPGLLPRRVPRRPSLASCPQGDVGAGGAPTETENHTSLPERNKQGLQSC